MKHLKLYEKFDRCELNKKSLNENLDTQERYDFGSFPTSYSPVVASTLMVKMGGVPVSDAEFDEIETLCKNSNANVQRVFLEN